MKRWAICLLLGACAPAPVIPTPSAGVGMRCFESKTDDRIELFRISTIDPAGFDAEDVSLGKSCVKADTCMWSFVDTYMMYRVAEDHLLRNYDECRPPDRVVVAPDRRSWTLADAWRYEVGTRTLRKSYYAHGEHDDVTTYREIPCVDWHARVRDMKSRGGPVRC